MARSNLYSFTSPSIITRKGTLMAFAEIISAFSVPIICILPVEDFDRCFIALGSGSSCVDKSAEETDLSESPPVLRCCLPREEPDVGSMSPGSDSPNLDRSMGVSERLDVEGSRSLAAAGVGCCRPG